MNGVSGNFYTNLADTPARVVPLLQSQYSWNVPSSSHYPRLLLIDQDLQYASYFCDQASSLRFHTKCLRDYRKLNYSEQQLSDVVIADFNSIHLYQNAAEHVVASLCHAKPVIIIGSEKDKDFALRINSNVYDFIAKTKKVQSILDAALDAQEWWNFLIEKKEVHQ